FSIPEFPSYENRFGFPYRTTLSFVPYIRSLEIKAKDTTLPEHSILRHVLREVKKCPELLEPIEDLSILDKYKKQVDLLLSSLLPTAIHEDLIAGVVIPFQPITLYSTQQFKDIMGNLGHGIWDLKKMNPEKGLRDLIAYAGLAILEKY